MKITKDPRCPDHPEIDVLVSYRPSRSHVGQWTCAACHRPLGLASFSMDAPPRAPMSPQRRMPPRIMAERVIDFDWICWRRRDRFAREMAELADVLAHAE